MGTFVLPENAIGNQINWNYINNDQVIVIVPNQIPKQKLLVFIQIFYQSNELLEQIHLHFCHQKLQLSSPPFAGSKSLQLDGDKNVALFRCFYS